MLLLVLSFICIILRVDGCCDIHLSDATCLAETGLDCVWLPLGDERIKLTDSGNQQCVASNNADCLQLMIDSGRSRPDVCPPILSPPPSEQICAFESCTNDEYKYNIQFILDESGSVGSANYDNSVDFVKQMINNDVNSASPISVYSFSNEVDELWRFYDPQNNRNGVLSALDNAKSSAGNYQGQCTDTLSALEDGVSEYERANIAGELVSGDKYLFLITDGVPYCGCGLSASCNPDVCGTGGESLRHRIDVLGIRLFIMGIGNFKMKTIECLADPNNILQVDGFTNIDFSTLEEHIRPNLCPVIQNKQIFSEFIAYSIQTLNQSSLLIKSFIIIIITLFIIYQIYKKIYTTNKESKYDTYQYHKLIQQPKETKYGTITNTV